MSRVLTDVTLSGRTIACGGPASFSYTGGKFSLTFEIGNPDDALKLLSWFEGQKEPLVVNGQKPEQVPATDDVAAAASAEAPAETPSESA
jgi:hypothetical protein